uniref:PDZ domain-containing protein n=1 Tax=Macrostomum lignano TaxID=282301 RepID=A0A1I8HLL0_9PLAT
FALLACRHQLAGRRAPRLSLPPPELRGLALQQLQSQRAGIAKGVLTDLPPACRIGRDCLVLDLAPCLLDILQPSLRPVSTHLYTAKERRDLATLVDCMICYGLHYTQQRSPDGQMQFALEPPLDQLVRFSEPPAAAPPAATTTTSTTSTSAGRRPPLSGAVKQLVARELQAERLRRADAAAAARLGPTAPTSASTTGASAPANLLNDRIWFRFNEGFSNAVRRPVRVRTFHNLLDAYQNCGVGTFDFDRIALRTERPLCSQWEASSFSSWAGSRRSSLQAVGAVRRSEAVEAAQLNDARVQLARQCAEVRLRNRPLGERIREKFRSLQDSDLDQGQQRRRHAVEELLALRSTSAAVSSGASSVDPVEFCNRSLGFRLYLGTAVGMAAAAETSRPVRVTSVDLDGPADKCGIHPGDEILSVDGQPALSQSPSSAASSSTEEVARRLVDAVVADGVVHIRVRRRLPEPKEPSAPPLPPLDTLPSQRDSAPPVVSDDATEEEFKRGSKFGKSAAAVTLSPKLLLAATIEEKLEAGNGAGIESSVPLTMDL